MDELNRLHHLVHANDQEPQNTDEEIVQIVMDGFKRLVLNLIMDGATLRSVELSLFYFWHFMLVRHSELEMVPEDVPM